jgi:hypothetical protein
VLLIGMVDGCSSTSTISSGVFVVDRGEGIVLREGAPGLFGDFDLWDGAPISVAYDAWECLGSPLCYMCAYHENWVSVDVGERSLGSIRCGVSAGKSCVNRRVSMDVQRCCCEPRLWP